MAESIRCPCGSGAPYDDCCGRLHRGEARAITAEQVMRARYSAFARGELGYLGDSWHPATRPTRIMVDPERSWVGLEVRATAGGGPLDQEGTVEFEARHRRGDDHGVLREVSRFSRVEGRWVYVGPAAGTSGPDQAVS